MKRNIQSIGQRPLSPSGEGGRRHLRAAAGFALLFVTIVFCAALAETVKAVSEESGGQGRGVASRPSAAQTQKVLMCSSAPETAISLQEIKNGQSVSNRPLGTTKARRGKEGGFFVDIAPGEYLAIGNKPGYQQGTRRFIVNVRPTQPETCIDMTETPAAPTPTPTPAATPTPPPTTPTPETKTALQRFTDPKESDQVKAEDWSQFLPVIYEQLKNNANDPQLKAREQFARAQIQFLSGDHEKALNIYNTIDVPKTTPEYSLVQYGKGLAYNASEQYSKAETACKEVVSGSPDPKLLWLGRRCLGDVYSSWDKKEKAETEYAEARRLGYERAGLSLDALRRLVKKGKAREALPELRALVDKEPSGAAYTVLGDAYEKEDGKASAYTEYSNAIRAYLEKRQGGRLDPAAAEALFKAGKTDLDEKNTEKGWIRVACALDIDTEAKFIDRKKAREMADEAYKKLNKRPGGFTRPAEPCEMLTPTPARP